MNDWMRSVADIPPGDDEDDDLAGISPELVLVDPDLARLVRERGPQPAALGSRDSAARPKARPRTSRGGRGVSRHPPCHCALVGRRQPVSRGPERAAGDLGCPACAGTAAVRDTARSRDARSPPGAGRGRIPCRRGAGRASAPPTPAGRSRNVVDDAPGLEPGAPIFDVEASPASEPDAPEPRIVDAELARALAPEPPRSEIPPPLADPVRASAVEARHAPPPLAQAAMPHPVARPVAGTRPRPARGMRRSRRRWPAFLLVVAVASATVFGVYQVFGGSQDPAGNPRGTAAVGAPPHANATSGSKSTAKPKQASTSRPKPTPKKAAATSETPKPKQAGTPKKATTSKQAVETPKPATKPKTSSKPKTSTKPKTSSKPAAGAETPKPTAPAATRRFAWAPVEGATGYHVELFRGADRVLAQDTKEPVLELGSTWRYQGREMHLTPGTYRWYVWPITQAGRASQAIVQAKLPVS